MANKIADIVKQALSERGQPTKRRRPSTKKPPDRKKRASGKPKTMPATLASSQEFVEQFAEA